MSMEIHVLSDRELASIFDWQQAIDREGFDLRLSSQTRLEAVRGFVAANLDEKKTGFECVRDDVRELMAVYADIDFVRPWRHALSFRWAADVIECLAAWLAATAYAAAVDGVVFDPQQGKIFTPPEARDVVRDIKRDLPAIKEALRQVLERLNHDRRSRE